MRLDEIGISGPSCTLNSLSEDAIHEGKKGIKQLVDELKRERVSTLIDETYTLTDLLGIKVLSDIEKLIILSRRRENPDNVRQNLLSISIIKRLESICNFYEDYASFFIVFLDGENNEENIRKIKLYPEELSISNTMGRNDNEGNNNEGDVTGKNVILKLSHIIKHFKEIEDITWGNNPIYERCSREIVVKLKKLLDFYQVNL